MPIGDQPSDIEKQTRTLISEYIAKPNSIILAVSPANVDIVNSESLKLARYVDPMGKRTIGVLTKLDLMDHGTNALDILSGRVYPLKLGFIGVVNRSQQDIQINKNMADALQAERDFFRHHPAYRNMAARCGTQFLAKQLNSTLMNHIRERLPDIKARLNTLMGQTQQELASYGDTAFTGKEHRGSLILQLMTRFASSFISSIDGTSSEISTKELCGGARIYYIFNSVFGNSLETIDPTHNLSALDIRTAIRNSTGPRPSLFVPEMAFDLLVKPQIMLLGIPSQRCVELVYEELIKICHTCGSTELSRYPRLQGKLIEVVSDLLRERLGPCSGYVESLISIQRAYINTNHPNFLGAAAAMSSVIQDKQEKERKAVQDAERRKRDRRRMKELNGVNGVDTPEEEEEGDGAVEKVGQLPLRGHNAKARSMSPAVGGRTPIGGGHSIAGALNGSSNAAGQAGSAKDSFLNYFFGKEGGNPSGNALPPSNLDLNRPGSRHVSANIEPNFSSSIRQGNNTRFIEHTQDDFDIGSAREHDSPFVSTYKFRKVNFLMLTCFRRLARNHRQLSRIVKPWRRILSAASFPHTSTLSAKPLPIKSRKLSCICLLTTRRTSSRIDSSARCTKRIFLKSCCTKTTPSRQKGRSASSCSTRIKRRPRLLARFCNLCLYYGLCRLRLDGGCILRSGTIVFRAPISYVVDFLSSCPSVSG